MTPMVYLVDDDEAIRDALTWLFESRGIEAMCWASAEEFLAYQKEHAERLAGCVLLDIRMGGMSGLELFEQLKQRSFELPVIFLTGHGDVPMAVGALKKGALDFFEKPFDETALVQRIVEAMRLDDERRANRARSDDTGTRLASLSDRERQVMELVLAGKLNKVIADVLAISMRTVEVHRSRVFDKMGVKSAVELAQLLKSQHP